MKIRLAAIIALLLATGCVRKDDLTLPVKVYFKFGILRDYNTSKEYLEFTGCRIGIQQIGFAGSREAGGDIYFTSDPSLNLQTLSFTQEPVTISEFDIPQGVYDSMKWDITLKCVDAMGLTDGRNESSPCISIVFTGNYTSLRGSVIPLILDIDKPEIFRILASDPGGDPIIVLSVGKEYEAIVWFTPEFAFSVITRQLLEEAEISGDNDNYRIIISSRINKELYQILLYRIIQSASVIVK